ncbi:MAG: hypothetical protein K2X38_08000 [Gemmataceae bacterium]|nr:hypothetical protein [Gemmataceae bacterium]
MAQTLLPLVTIRREIDAELPKERPYRLYEVEDSRGEAGMSLRRIAYVFPKFRDHRWAPQFLERLHRLRERPLPYVAQPLEAISLVDGSLVVLFHPWTAAADNSTTTIETLAKGLASLHAAGLVHGAITPNAVWRSEGGAACLGDVLLGSLGFWSSGAFMHAKSAEYAPPEFEGKSAAPTFRGDLYSLAKSSLQLLGIPHDDAKAIGRLTREQHSFLVPMLEADPARRPASGADALRRLDAFRSNRRRMRAGIVGVMLLIMTSLVAWQFSKTRQATDAALIADQKRTDTFHQLETRHREFAVLEQQRNDLERRLRAEQEANKQLLAQVKNGKEPVPAKESPLPKSLIRQEAENWWRRNATDKSLSFADMRRWGPVLPEASEMYQQWCDRYESYPNDSQSPENKGWWIRLTAGGAATKEYGKSRRITITVDDVAVNSWKEEWAEAEQHSYPRGDGDWIRVRGYEPGKRIGILIEYYSSLLVYREGAKSVFDGPVAVWKLHQDRKAGSDALWLAVEVDFPRGFPAVVNVPLTKLAP